MRDVNEWSVLADDRTGALDAAGEMARWMGPVLVGSSRHRGLVVDLGSRVLDAHQAAAAVRAAAVDARLHLHKIDSMLRGNWCAELIARSDATARRVLLVPAWPEMRRTCRGGVVEADGAVVGRPAEYIASLGLTVSRIDAGALQRWGSSADRFAVCDATDHRHLRFIARWWLDHSDDVLLAGPAGVLGAAAAESWRGRAVPPAAEPPLRLPAPLLVVCASVHPIARAQVDVLRRVRPDVTIAVSPMPPDNTAQGDPGFVAEWSAATAAATARAGTLVLIGGDTAAGIMGAGQWICSGTVGQGVAVSRRVDGAGPVYLTKAGAFGDASTLVRVIDMVGDGAAG